MGLNIANGNMYEFVTHTWNTLTGECFHDCSYCYMKRCNVNFPVRFVDYELNTNFGSGKFIFVGSNNDLWADNIPSEWIQKTLDHCAKYTGNRYFFQTKNPKRFSEFKLPPNSSVCITLETNRWLPEIMRNSPTPAERVEVFSKIDAPKYITVEPILDFDTEEFVEMIKRCSPIQVNFGADSQNHKLPEPDLEKLRELRALRGTDIKLHGKSNFKRLTR